MLPSIHGQSASYTNQRPRRHPAHYPRASPAFGVMFIGLGNYMPKLKQNYTIGIKVPWTLNSEENWNMTHRMAGKLYVVAGVISIIIALLNNVLSDEVTIIIFMVVFLVTGIGSVAYSFWLYKVKGL